MTLCIWRLWWQSKSWQFLGGIYCQEEKRDEENPSIIEWRTSTTLCHNPFVQWWWWWRWQSLSSELLGNTKGPTCAATFMAVSPQLKTANPIKHLHRSIFNINKFSLRVVPMCSVFCLFSLSELVSELVLASRWKCNIQPTASFCLQDWTDYVGLAYFLTSWP